jgi:hypothetical protein
MPILDFEFETWVDTKGYECVPDRLGVDTTIRRRGGALRKMRPLSFHPTLYKQFADLPDNPEAFREFMDNFGPVSRCHRDPSEDDDNPMYKALDDRGESFENLKISSAMLRYFISAWQADPSTTVPLVEKNLFTFLMAQLVRRPNGSLTLHFFPHSLQEAMRLQLGVAISSDRAIRACDWCNGWFEVGAQSKRSSSRFCSDRCRTRFHNDRRLKGAKP